MSILACHKKIAFNFFDLPSIFAFFWSYAVPANCSQRNLIALAFFFSSCRARSRLGQSSKRLVVDQLFSLCKRTGEKQKARCLPKSKQNQPQTQTQPKQKTTEEDTRQLSETLRFQKNNPRGAQYLFTMT